MGDTYPKEKPLDHVTIVFVWWEVSGFCFVSEDVFLEPIPARIGRETLDETRRKHQLIKTQTDGP